MKRRVLKAAGWNLAEIGVKNGLALAFTIVLARLLTPADFGLVAMLSMFVGIATTLAEGGLGAALIQTPKPSETDKSTLFWAQLGLALVLGAALAGLGPWLAAWFDQPVLTPLAIAYGVNLLIGAPASIQISLFYKTLDVRAITLTSLIAQVAGGAVGVGVALRGAGPWAIVAQAIVASGVTTAMLWLQSSWRPRLTFSWNSLRQLGGFGASSVGIGMLAEVESRIASLTIGHFAGPADAGQYQRAASFQLLLARLMSGVVTRVAFPAFSAVQHDRARLANALREAAFINFAATAAIMWCVALVADPLVRLLFGAQWGPAAPVLQALCLAAGFYPVYAIFSKALRAVGQNWLVFAQHLVRAGGMCAVALAFGGYGFSTLAWAQAGFLILMLPMGALAVARSIGYGVRGQIADFAPIVVAGALMWPAALAVDPLVDHLNILMRIIIVASLAMFVYLAAIGLWLRLIPPRAGRMAMETLSMVLRRGRHSGEQSS
ncbi:lipopolysaccharide biosynthesis protein [Sphingomonas suaedae]|uniref:Lipopolysaccharide biosynthesis protein n=1 Tax=Sphingomonas suaedae TaxID=2599297 RepID=A0A518RJ32_9SPHN|nr:lipopolysaccharide biosynthesis protein [Sphingomonas suaedae]QDX27466.1 lipopolysaccharide biosynthesis protein [Sphingomonas suaedae]